MKNTKRLLALAIFVALIIALFAGCAPKETIDPGPADDTGETEHFEGDGHDHGEGSSFDYSGGLDDNGYWAGVTALDLVKLPSYLGVVIPSNVHRVNTADIAAEIDILLSEYADLEHLTDRAVEDGDTVNIDYVGSIDGVEFAGGSTAGQGTLVTIGVTQYIDDFLQQLVGHMPGDTFDVNVTFPDDYKPGDDTLNGKDAVFVTTINYIEGSEYISPELTDEFVTRYLQPNFGWQSVEEMSAQIESELRNDAIATHLQTYILENSEIGQVPPSIVDYQKNSYISSHESQAAYYGITMEEYYSAYGVAGMDELIEEALFEIEENAKFVLIVQAIAEDAKIIPTESQLAGFFAENGIIDYAPYIENYGEPYFKMAYISQSVLNLMRDNAVLE